LPRSRLDVRVSAAPCGLSSSHRPRLLAKPVHSPASFASPSEFERPTTCSLQPSATLRPPRSQRAPPWGFRPSSRHQPAASTSDRSTQLRPDAPSMAFRTPSTVYSATSLAGLFHPAATSRVRSSGVCPSPWSLCRLSPTVALWPVGANPPAVARASESAPELQGVDSPRRVRWFSAGG
jgi:hypothetical protein